MAGRGRLEALAAPLLDLPTDPAFLYDFDNLADLARTLNAFESHWNEIAELFDWRFTRDDLAALLERLAAHESQLQLACGHAASWSSGSCAARHAITAAMSGGRGADISRMTGE